MINEDKDIFDMLGEMEVDLDEYKQEELTDIEKMKLKKNFRKVTKNSSYKKYVSAAAVAIVALGVISQSKIGAYANSALEDIAEVVKVALRVDGKIGEYSQNVNKSITRNKLSIKLEDVILDEKELIVHTSSKYGKELDSNMYIDIASPYLYINGELLNPSQRGYSGTENSLDEDSIVGYELPKEYSGDIDVKLRFMTAEIRKYDDPDYVRYIIGPWTFKFTVNSDKLNKDTKKLKIDKEIKMDTGISMNIESYRGNLLKQKIYLSMAGFENLSNKKNVIDIILKGRDDIGNKIEFTSIVGSIHSKSSKYVYEYNNLIRKFDNNAKQLYLTPYLITVDESIDEHVYTKIGEEFTIDLTK